MIQTKQTISPIEYFLLHNPEYNALEVLIPENVALCIYNVMKRLSELDALVQKTIPHECLSIHTEIDSIIDDVSELIDYI